MKRNPRKINGLVTGRVFGSVLAALALLLPGAAGAAEIQVEGESAIVSGMDGASPLVSVQADGVPISEALKEICKKAKWGLVLDADADLLAQKVTVLLPQKKPAAKVLEMILLQKGLQAHLDDGVLRVSGMPGPTPNVGVPADMPETVESPPDTDSKAVVIDDFSKLREMKSRIKEKFREHQKHHDRHGESDDDGVERVEMGGPVVIAKDETVSKAISFGDSVTVAGVVEKEAVAIGGNVTIKKGAVVKNDVAAVGGDVLIENGATVAGEAVAVGGQVTVEDGAVVSGDRVSVNIPVPAISGVAGVLGMGAMFWVLAAILRSAVILAVALIIVWIAPRRVTIAKEYLQKKSGWSLFSGLLIMLGTIPAIVLLAITIIGIPLIPFLLLLLLGIVIFGLAALLLWLGYWIPVFKKKKNHTGAIVIGFLAFLIINMIPVVGGIFLLIASLAAAGATFLSRFGKESRAL